MSIRQALRLALLAWIFVLGILTYRDVTGQGTPAWVKTYTRTRFLYTEPNGNGGKVLESVSGNYLGAEDNISLFHINFVPGWIGNGISVQGNTCLGTNCNEPFVEFKYDVALEDTTFKVSWVGISSTTITGYMWASVASTAPQFGATVGCRYTNLNQVACTIKENSFQGAVGCAPASVGTTTCNGPSVTLTTTGFDKTDGAPHRYELRAEAANIHRLYVDGVLNVSNTTTTIGSKSQMEFLYVNPNVSSTIEGNLENTIIDEFHIYSVAGSGADAVTLWNGGIPTETVLPNATSVYHFNQTDCGTLANRCDFDEVQAWVKPGDEVGIKVVPPDPGYKSDRVDQGQRDFFPWYTLTASGTAANPIVYKCESNWPADCRFQSRIDMLGNYVWLWGVWNTGANGSNTQYCQSADGGPGTISLDGIGQVLVNNWSYHPANFPCYPDANLPPSEYCAEGRGGVFLSQQQSPPAAIVYGNMFKKGGHGTYAQNDYFDAGFQYFVQNMYMDPIENPPCDLVKNDPNETGPYDRVTPGKLVGHWGTNVMNTGWYLKDNYYADTEGIFANEWFMTSEGTGPSSLYSHIESCEIFGGGRMLTPPKNGRIAFGSGSQGHPSQVTFVNNFGAATQLWIPFFWGTGEVRFPELIDLPNIYNGNTILPDPTIDTEAVYLRTSAYDTLTHRSDGGPGTRLRAMDQMEGNKYTTNSTFELVADGVTLNNRTFAQWKTDTAGKGKAFDTTSTTQAYPTTGARVVLKRNEYDLRLGNLMIYNWGGAQNVSVDFGAVCPVCSKFDLYDAHIRPDSTPILQNVTYNGQAINVPIAGKLAKLYRIRVKDTVIANCTNPDDWNIIDKAVNIAQAIKSWAEGII